MKTQFSKCGNSGVRVTERSMVAEVPRISLLRSLRCDDESLVYEQYLGL
jgi:hypothetical protein